MAGRTSSKATRSQTAPKVRKPQLSLNFPTLKELEEVEDRVSVYPFKKNEVVLMFVRYGMRHTKLVVREMIGQLLDEAESKFQDADDLAKDTVVQLRRPNGGA